MTHKDNDEMSQKQHSFQHHKQYIFKTISEELAKYALLLVTENVCAKEIRVEILPEPDFGSITLRAYFNDECVYPLTMRCRSTSGVDEFFDKLMSYFPTKKSKK